MKLFTVRINNRDIYATEAIDRIEAFAQIKQNLPELLSYPHFWCLSCCPSKIPMTVPEKIIFFSKPYRYYINHKNDPDRAKKIETNKGYYFQGKNIVECIKDINYLVTASDSDSTDDDTGYIADCGGDNKTKILMRREKIRKKKIRMMGGIYKSRKKKIERKNNKSEGKSEPEGESEGKSEGESEGESESEGEGEEVFNLHVIYYIKKYMTLEVFTNVINSSLNRKLSSLERHDNIELVISNFLPSMDRNRCMCVIC